MGRHDRRPSFFDELGAAKWQEMKTQGKSQFIFERRILHWAVPTAVMLSFWVHFRVYERELSDVWSIEYVWVLLVCLVAALSTAYVFGLMEWRRMRRKHGEPDEQDG